VIELAVAGTLIAGTSPEHATPGTLEKLGRQDPEQPATKRQARKTMSDGPSQRIVHPWYARSFRTKSYAVYFLSFSVFTKHLRGRTAPPG
jgi:hypothetical protein